MAPHDYQNWLAGLKTGPSAASSGAELFAARACNTCHRPDSSARAPFLNGLLGRTVLLADGRRITADAAYVRESIMDPQAKLVAGYQPIMPTFKGQLSEEEIIRLIEYVRTLAPVAEQGAARSRGTRP